MKDILGNIITDGNILEDYDGRKYEVIDKNEELYAKSLFEDSGCGEYFLYQERIEKNEFKIAQ